MDRNTPLSEVVAWLRPQVQWLGLGSPEHGQEVSRSLYGVPSFCWRYLQECGQSESDIPWLDEE